MSNTKVALITGSAKRVGATIARALHQRGMNVIIHYNRSQQEAQQLCTALNEARANSAFAVPANLTQEADIYQLIEQSVTQWGRLDVLINNAATFDATPLASLTVTQWRRTLSSNLDAPFFLSIQASPHLKLTQGSIINLVDIRAQQPLKHYTPYCISKAGLVMMTKALAIEWAPHIRVNGIAPGVVFWPDETSPAYEKLKKQIIARTPLKRTGEPTDVAKAVLFLIEDSHYITGQILTVDGGRSLAY